MENKFTAEMIEKAKAAKTPDELTTIAKENKIELTADEAKEYYDKLNKSGELADDELDNVSGGCGQTEIYGEEAEKMIQASLVGFRCPFCDGNLWNHPEKLYCSSCQRVVMKN